jgi:CRP-like cAMP-binding protein
VSEIITGFGGAFLCLLQGGQRPHLEAVDMPSGQIIHEPGAVTEHVFFPTRGLTSMVASMSDGACVEIGMIGKEGMFSVGAILGDNKPSQRALAGC